MATQIGVPYGRQHVPNNYQQNNGAYNNPHEAVAYATPVQGAAYGIASNMGIDRLESSLGYIRNSMEHLGQNQQQLGQQIQQLGQNQQQMAQSYQQHQQQLGQIQQQQVVQNANNTGFMNGMVAGTMASRPGFGMLGMMGYGGYGGLGMGLLSGMAFGVGAGIGIGAFGPYGFDPGMPGPFW